MRQGLLRGLNGEWRTPYGPISPTCCRIAGSETRCCVIWVHRSAILDEGVAERTKSTGRMYEQWIFLQTLAAFRACGLLPMSQEGLQTRSRRHRFTLDLERGPECSSVAPTDALSVSVMESNSPWDEAVEWTDLGPTGRKTRNSTARLASFSQARRQRGSVIRRSMKRWPVLGKAFWRTSALSESKMQPQAVKQRALYGELISVVGTSSGSAFFRFR